MSKRNAQKQFTQQQHQQAMEQALAKAAADLSPIACACGCTVFLPGLTAKLITKERLSILGVTAPANILYQIPQLACLKCGEYFQEPKKETLIS